MFAVTLQRMQNPDQLGLEALKFTCIIRKFLRSQELEALFVRASR